MRHRSALLTMKMGWCALAALLLAVLAGQVQAQAPLPFDSLDWLLDRGGTVPGFGPNNSNPLPIRLGYNGFTDAGNNVGAGNRKWVFPRTIEIPLTSVVDNPNPNRPAQTGTPQPPDAIAAFLPNFGSWTIPAPANRAPGRGFSFSTDPNDPTSFDYGYVLAAQQDFLVARGNGTTSKATIDELNRLPNAPANVYRAVHNTLIQGVNGGQPSAVWTSGTLRFPNNGNQQGAISPGYYSVDIFSPGDGTTGTDGLVHPNAIHAFVRVSWGNTTDGNGNLNFAGINDPTTSRIFMVDLSQQGWIHIAGENGGLGPAVFPYDGNPAHPLTVTLYTVTPDANNTVYQNPPIITADAVRFVPQFALNGVTNGVTGFSGGRILGPAVGTKLGGQPFFFFAREEGVPDTTLRSAADPTQGPDDSAPDPTAQTTAPVFYCLDNRPGADANGNVISSTDRVRWRYVGASDGTGTSSASPLLANVRCRDGVVRPILYFATTNAAGSLGHLYALDPNGDPNNKVTTAYWAYPSIRPLVVRDPQNVPAQYHDPNYTGFVRGTYPQPTFGQDTVPLNDVIHFDGDLVQSPTAGQLVVRSDTQIPAFAGVQSAPTVVNDPNNPNGAQLVVVGCLNGRVYAFDAGGRGDFDPDPTKNVSGTTQRIWTWPQLGADAWRYLNNPTASVPPDVQAKGAFAASPAQNPNFNGASSPIIIGSVDGHLYAVNPAHDRFRAIVNGRPVFDERLNWQYPGPGISLGQSPSTAAIYKGRVYFTSGGRVYAVNETPPGGTLPVTNTLSWVYPFTDNVPFPSPNPPNPNSGDPNDTTIALDPGFNGTAPILVDGTTIRPDGTLPDLCYVLQGDGTVLALNAAGSGGTKTTLVASGGTLTAGSTRSTPTLAVLTGQSGLDPTSHPAVVFGDDDGAIWAINADPISPDGVSPANFLEVLWEHNETAASRPAPPILANGTIVEGDEGGQFRAYGPGLETVGPGEPEELANGVGFVTIDIRGLDLYKPGDWDRFMLVPGDPNFNLRETPAYDANGARYSRTADPMPSNVGANGVATDWGTDLYVAAYGVYHAQNTNDSGPPPSVPNVTAIFTITQPGHPSRTFSVTVPPVDQPGPIGPMPDDTAVDQDVSIYALDPNSGQQQLFTGRANGTYPWVAKVRIPIIPDINTPYAPGSTGYRITARAIISQSGIQGQANGIGATIRRESNIIRLGQRDYAGLSSQTPLTPNQFRGQQRRVFIAHPLALTIRNYSGTNMTGQPNVIGWAPDVTQINDTSELLGNGNRITNASTGAAQAIKALFAPVGMIPDGSSGSYMGIDNNGNKVPAFFVMDRSNLAAKTGKALTVRVLTNGFTWYGGPSSVMNPLPWDQMPDNGQTTPDYPGMPPDALSIKINNQDLQQSSVALKPPIQDTSGDPTLRTPQPTPVDMSVSVPRFQPANVNRGAIKWVDPQNQNTYNFGSAYTDISGAIRGENGDSILGLMQVTSGTPVTGGALAFPAAGYISEVIVLAEPANNGQLGQGIARFRPELAFNDAREIGLSPVQEAYRAVDVGLTVPPNIKLRVAEETVDLGKVPHGTGYSDILANGSPRIPFAPTGSSDYPNGNSPWNDDNQLGNFFRPITVINEGNVNLWHLRLSKLRGIPGAAVGPQSLSYLPPANFASSARLVSDQVDNLLTGGLFAMPYGTNGNTGAEGNFGIVSSFDHLSRNSGNNFPERPLWPLPNPEVTAAGIQAAFGPLFGPLNNIGWTDGTQPWPTLHKARVGDAQGTVATVPDKSHDTQEIAGFQFRQPQVGVAVPLGTPVGTYANPIFVYEDNLPIQWREWLSSTQSNAALGADNDAILNVDPNTGFPVEAYADPTFTLKVRVREARLTGGVTKGTLGEVDPLGTLPLSADLLPTAYRNPDPNAPNISLFWATNRDPNTGAILPEAPWSLAFSRLPGLVNTVGNGFSFLDYRFAVPGALNQAQWWSPTTLFPGYNNGQPANLADLFPSAPTNNGVPYLPGNPIPQTVRYASPQVAVAVHSDGTQDPEAYLFFQGNVDKARSQQREQQDSRTFWTALDATGTPTGPILSFLNDPALTKLSPKPLLVKLDAANGASAQKMLYLFWHAGNQSQTTLYYNVNVAADVNSAFAPTGWSQDTKLPTPGALVWQSDPYPVYRRVVVRDPTSGQFIQVDAIDIVYTGVLKNRQTVEVLLTRYGINRTPPRPNHPEDLPVGGLYVMQLPAVEEETLTRVGSTTTWAARDAAWYLDYQQGTVVLTLLKNGDPAQRIDLNLRPDNRPQLGRFDQASGLVYYNSKLGGQIVVDSRSGTVSFPNVPPGRNDIVLASYIPQVMRLNATRDETNIIRTRGYGNFAFNDPAFRPRPATTAPGDNQNPIAILDRGFNPRTQLSAPPVTVGNPPVDRFWTLYRKSDPNGTVPSAIYYKAMRLLVRLPRPFHLGKDNNGNPVIPQFTIQPDAQLGRPIGPYEVDWVRGRIYFTEQDEGNVIHIQYAADQNGQSVDSGDLTYRVAWGDEVSVAAQPNEPNRPYTDETTPEVIMPTDSAVNEGQVSAFKDPFSDKLWVFWTSTRAGTTDLFYQTLAPQFYRTSTSQH